MFRPVDPQPNFPKLEEQILKFWEREKIFEKSIARNAPHNYPRPSRERGRRYSDGVRGKLFTFYDGPPFATGLPHYGHILASTIKDLIPRYQTMKGRYVRRRWGWDCHGLPIEEIVERELKISGKKEIEKIGIKKFNETCRSMVLQYVTEWGKMVRRIARWTEFDNAYKTMDRDYMESVWWAFKEIYNKGLVYEGRKVLLYCPRCETPISNFEVAMDNSYQDVTEEAVTVKFKIKGSPSTSSGTKKNNYRLSGVEGPMYFLAWTTTPWTLPGNIALAVGKDIEYVIFKKDNAYYIAAKTPSFPPPHEGGKGEVIVDVVKGKDLVGLEYEPLFDVPAFAEPINGHATGSGSAPIHRQKVYKVYAADFVNTEEGTGIVHTAVVYGEDDYALGTKVGLPVVPLLDEKGKFNEQSPKLIRGQYFKVAEKAIKKDLESRGLLFARKSHQHSYPHCWRCGTMLYYNAIPAWFINIQKIKKKLLASNKKEINWFPEHLKFGRYAKSVEAAPDWNISRNRYWGNPIPVWKCESCKKNTVIGSVEELKEKFLKFSVIPATEPESRSKSGLDFRLRGNDKVFDNLDLHRPYIDEVIVKCDHCGGQAKRITEIFDSWVEAGSMPFASVHYPFGEGNSSPPSGGGAVGGFIFPAQFVTEYIAQTRAWFYVMHVISIILFGKAPFENVLTTGTLMAEDGNKLSKSKRNFPDPWQVIEKYGVDSLRFYLMNSVVMQADNQNFSERDLATTYRKVILILWNVYNYFVTYANEAGWNPSTRLKPRSGNSSKGLSTGISPELVEGSTILDQWILDRLQELINSVTNHLDSYNTVRATREIESFINDLSTWYLRRSRGRTDAAFFFTFHFVLIELSKVIAPVMPYISEIIYGNLKVSVTSKGDVAEDFSPPSVHLADWPEAKKLTSKQQELLAQMQEIRKIVEQVHALRAKAGIKLRQKLPRLVIPAKAGIQGMDPRVKPEDDKLLSILRDEVNVAAVEFGDKLELDTTITPELKIEGLARELERQIQSFRKESGLKIGEMVELRYETESDIIKKAIQKIDRNKIFVENLEVSSKKQVGLEKEIELEGNNVKFQISNINGSTSLTK